MPEKWLASLPNDFLAAVKKNGMALEYVPDNLKTAEMCLEAVQRDGLALEYVPDNLKTEEMCRRALRQIWRAFEHVPDNLKTAELCLEAIQKNERNIKWTPENLKTAELCLAAVQQGAWALGQVPANLRTEELCREAVRQGSIALDHVPENLKTKEMYQNARITMYAHDIERIPPEYQTEEHIAEVIRLIENPIDYDPAFDDETKTAEFLSHIKAEYREKVEQAIPIMKTEPPFHYEAAITWKGDTARGAEFERNFTAAVDMELNGSEESPAGLIRKAIGNYDASLNVTTPLTAVQSFKHERSKEIPQTLMFEMTQPGEPKSGNVIESFSPVFNAYPELDFLVTLFTQWYDDEEGLVYIYETQNHRLIEWDGNKVYGGSGEDFFPEPEFYIISERTREWLNKLKEKNEK